MLRYATLMNNADLVESTVPAATSISTRQVNYVYIYIYSTINLLCTEHVIIKVLL